jgi:hypothetical protein
MLFIYLFFWYWDLNPMLARQVFYLLSHSTSPETMPLKDFYDRNPWTILRK